MSQQGGASQGAESPSRLSTSTMDMTTLDDLTHDFANNAGFRAWALDKYGQYFSHDGKRVQRKGQK